MKHAPLRGFRCFPEDSTGTTSGRKTAGVVAFMAPPWRKTGGCPAGLPRGCPSLCAPCAAGRQMQTASRDVSSVRLDISTDRRRTSSTFGHPELDVQLAGTSFG
ncbi:hypothetical protein GCM10009867_21380 [Pedococcus aerophilus]|uniref:Uncharacterized protein n=1 Tax=Pedococcus aerophilus TaxID=436356 RepID=A0ABP6H5L7_9MICO